LQAKLSIPFVLLLRSKPKLDRRGFTNQVICEISPKKSRLFLGPKLKSKSVRNEQEGGFTSALFVSCFFLIFSKSERTRKVLANKKRAVN
jgi:hypothetical protein